MKKLAKNLLAATFLLYAVSKLLYFVNRYAYPISDNFKSGFLFLVLIGSIITEIIINVSRGHRNGEDDES